jgi:prevent-host-death family protein
MTHQASQFCQPILPIHRLRQNPELTMVIDHVVNRGMKEVAISEFKAKCLGILEEVRKTRKPIRVTRFGEPVAEVVPPTAEKTRRKEGGSFDGGKHENPW